MQQRAATCQKRLLSDRPDAHREGGRILRANSTRNCYKRMTPNRIYTH